MHGRGSEVALIFIAVQNVPPRVFLSIYIYHLIEPNKQYLNYTLRFPFGGDARVFEPRTVPRSQSIIGERKSMQDLFLTIDLWIPFNDTSQFPLLLGNCFPILSSVRDSVGINATAFNLDAFNISIIWAWRCFYFALLSDFSFVVFLIVCQIIVLFYFYKLPK